MEEAGAVAGALLRIIGRPLLERELHLLLFYAHAIELAETGRSLVTGLFVADDESPKLTISHAGRPDDIIGVAPTTEARLREIAVTFGTLGIETLAASARSEIPWRRARKTRDRVISRTDIQDAYALMIENGSEAMTELGVPTTAGVPTWWSCYRTDVNLSRYEAHPLFDDAASRRMRTSLGLGDTPDRP